MLNITKIRAVLKTAFVMPHASQSQIAKLTECSRQSVGRLLKKAKKQELSHVVAAQCKNSEIIELLYPTIHTKSGNKRQPNFEKHYLESIKPRGQGKSTTVLYLEYHAENPDTAYSKTQYFYLVRKFLKKCRLAMRQRYYGGEILFIDYAGTKVKYSQNGEHIWLKIFVACFGASKKLFSFATAGERTIDWLNGLTRALNYYGGVPEVISIDNARALVTKAGLQPVLVKNLALFGDHYNCIIDSCRVGKPQDKALVELGVKFIKQRALIPMNEDFTFHSIDELNAHLCAEVEKLNNSSLQKLNLTRNDLFEQIEKEALSLLPKQPFHAVYEFKTQKVPPTYHLEVDGHEYSVPYKSAHETVNVLVTQTHVRIEHDNECIAEHLRSDEVNGFTTVPTHMPPQHQAEALKTRDTYIEWASSIGENALKYVQRLYVKTKNPHSRGVAKQCQGLMNTLAFESHEKLERVFDYALKNKTKPANIRLVLSAIENLTPPDVPVSLLVHKNVRGKQNYGVRDEN
jgi:transposase